MARFLSPEWFEEVQRATPAGDGQPDGADPLVLQQVVTGTPHGEVRYTVIVAGSRVARVETEPAGAEPDLTITVDWATACAVAQGRISTQQALMEGRLRIRGNLSLLAGHLAQLGGVDPVPAAVRRTTTY
jgi:hypothetical protein